MNNNLIYAYKSKIKNKIVYVGQTVDIEKRDYRHREVDPWNENLKEYNYPLSRGIRKYGKDNYELIILEKNLKKEQLNEKEKYYINLYNTYKDGYNQTEGGSEIPPYITIKDNKIDNIIYDLKYNLSLTMTDIAKKYSVSLTHIYNINNGNRRHQDNLTYPLRSNKTKGTKGLKFTQDECKKIHIMILQNNKTLKQIAEYFNCSSTTIRDINNGKINAYRLNGYNYPLRKDTKKISKKLYWSE